MISEQAISLLSKTCKDICKPLIAYIPNSTIWEPHHKSKQYKRELKAISKKMGIKFIDGEKVIDVSNPNDFAPRGPHLSIDGYKKIADLISKEIEN